MRNQIISLKRHAENSEHSYESKYFDMRASRDLSPEEEFPRRRNEGRPRNEYLEEPPKKFSSRNDIDQREENISEEPVRRRVNKIESKRQISPDPYEPVAKDERRKDYMPVRTIVNASEKVTEALNWKTGPSRPEPNPNPNAINNLQIKFNSLMQEQNRLQTEIEKVAEGKTPNATKRKNDLELELSICQANLNSVTSKLRKLNWLSNS